MHYHCITFFNNRSDVESQFLLTLFRILIFTICNYNEYKGLYIIQIIITFIFAIVSTYRIIFHLQFYMKLITIVYGSYCIFLCWLLISWIFTYVFDMKGHYLIISVGIFFIPIFSTKLNDWFINRALLRSIDKIYTEEEAVYQCYCIQVLVQTAKIDAKQEFKLIGLINRHFKICKKPNCELHKYSKLYNPLVGNDVKANEKKKFYYNEIGRAHV